EGPRCLQVHRTGGVRLRNGEIVNGQEDGHLGIGSAVGLDGYRTGIRPRRLTWRNRRGHQHRVRISGRDVEVRDRQEDVGIVKVVRWGGWVWNFEDPHDLPGNIARGGDGRLPGAG